MTQYRIKNPTKTLNLVPNLSSNLVPIVDLPFLVGANPAPSVPARDRSLAKDFDHVMKERSQKMPQDLDEIDATALRCVLVVF